MPSMMAHVTPANKTSGSAMDSRIHPILRFLCVGGMPSGDLTAISSSCLASTAGPAGGVSSVVT